MVLLSTYELGHQPFGLASAAAWLRREGAELRCLDLAVQALDAALLEPAALIGFYLPMHTATRLATALIRQARQAAPHAHLVCFGLYAPVNEPYLRSLGVQTILGGEFEAALALLYRQLVERPNITSTSLPTISLERLQFLPPDRSDLPALQRYAVLETATQPRVVGYTEASRGCKHRCRHCPIVPVYNGQFRVVQREVVLEDIRRQVAAGAQHITFGDPDFLNGPGHVVPLLQALHAEFPNLSYDVTIKIEHLLRYAKLLPLLHETGCLFVTSAVEAVDDRILAYFEKRHTRADFIEATRLLREHGLALNPTFVAFNPWISPQGYLELLQLIAELELIEHVAPIQYAIRLLIPAGSRLLELPEIQTLIGAFDPAALAYPWQHPDPRVDQLQQRIFALLRSKSLQRQPRQAVFEQVWQLAAAAAAPPLRLRPPTLQARTPIPHLSEPWYC